MAYKRKLNLHMSNPVQKYFLFFQCAILLTTLVFLFSIILKEVGGLTDPNVSQIVSDETMLFYDALIYSLFVKIAFLFAVMFILSGLLGLFFLERVTGPMIRIRKVLEEIGRGHIPNVNVQIRRADYPQDIAQALSSAIAYLKKK